MSDPTHIRAWQRLSDHVTTSGRLKDDDLSELTALGVKRVIDLTSLEHVEELADEAEKLAALGIAYHRLPVAFDAPQDEDYHGFIDLMRAGDEVTHVHCVANWRVSCFFYRYHLEQGLAEMDARQIMRQQWEPDASDHPVAAPWKAFVEQAIAARLEADRV